MDHGTQPKKESVGSADGGGELGALLCDKSRPKS